jgi:hypothetical protein
LRRIRGLVKRAPRLADLRGTARLKKNADGFEMSVGFGKPPAASIYCDQSNQRRCPALGAAGPNPASPKSLAF